MYTNLLFQVSFELWSQVYLRLFFYLRFQCKDIIRLWKRQKYLIHIYKKELHTYLPIKFFYTQLPPLFLRPDVDFLSFT